jgi:phospholipase/lecithinase/hemolysin
MFKHTSLFAATALFAVSMLSVTAHAAPSYDNEFVFGDSLSDRGNLAETGVLQGLAGLPTSANFPNPPSNHDSFTNGPVAVQLLAQSLGLNADPSLFVTGFKDVHTLFGGAAYAPGTNYAVAGAVSASALAKGGVTGANLPQQVGAYLGVSGGKADSNALYVVMIGGNDVRNAALYGTGAAAVTTGVMTEVGEIQSLSAAGARNFLVVNVPNVGVIPEFAQDTPNLAAAATTYSQQYDAQLSADLAGLSLPTGTSLDQFDLYSYNTLIADNAAALGFMNTTDRCFTTTPLSAAATPQCGPNGQSVNSFVYWDSIHPTGPVQALWAEGMIETLDGVADPSPIPGAGASAVPEPATLAVLAAGLLSLAGLRRRPARVRAN